MEQEGIEHYQNPEQEKIKEFLNSALEFAKEAGDILISRHGEIQEIEYN